jgi:hypothetical protein
MTKKHIIFNVSCIILLMLFFLLSSCSQAVSTSQDQTKYDAKISSGTTEKSLRQDGTRFYHAIPTIMEDHPGWDWCACAEICMAYIDPDFGYVDQSVLYQKGPFAANPLYNANDSIWSFYPHFNGNTYFIWAGAGSPGLDYVKLCIDGDPNPNHCAGPGLFIDERISRIPPFTKYTVVMFGYDLVNNQIAYFDPQTGFCGWVNYNSFLNNLSDNHSRSSYSNQMLAVYQYNW